MTLTTLYENGQIVFLITDVDQVERIITCIQVAANAHIMYQLSCGTVSSWHYECEIATNKDILKAINP